MESLYAHSDSCFKNKIQIQQWIFKLKEFYYYSALELLY